MDAGGPEQILSAHDVGHALAGHRRAQPRDDSSSACPCAPARRRPIAAVAPRPYRLLPPDRHRSRSTTARRCARSRRPCRGAAHRARRHRSAAAFALCAARAHHPDRAGHRRDRAAKGCRERPHAFALRNQPGDLAAALEARIDEPQRLEPGERRAIVIEMLALATDRLLPGDAEPGQILVDRLLVIRAAARRRRCPRCAAEAARPSPSPSRN